MHLQVMNSDESQCSGLDCDAVDFTYVRSYTAISLASMFGSNVRELVSLRTRQKILIRTGNFVG
jgi:hypothetical protein